MKKTKRNNELKCGILVGLLIFGIISVSAVFAGIVEQSQSRSYNYDNSCDQPWMRIEYIFPAFQLGCWLGDTPNETK